MHSWPTLMVMMMPTTRTNSRSSIVASAVRIGLTPEVGGRSSRPNHALTCVVTSSELTTVVTCPVLRELGLRKRCLSVKVAAVLVFLLSVIVIGLVGPDGAISARSAAPLDDDQAAKSPTPAEPFPMDLAFSRPPAVHRLREGGGQPDGQIHRIWRDHTPEGTRRSVDAPVGTADRDSSGPACTSPTSPQASPSPLGAEGPTSFAPSWSPDGTKLAYYSDEGGSLRAWVFDVARGKAAVAADMRIKVHLYTTTVMPPTWSPDGRQLLVPALPADEAHADPRPPRGRPVTGKGHSRPGTGVLVLQSGAEPAPPAEDPDGDVQQLRRRRWT